MTYNWNTMVEITVPTGTNGWLYSGEVIINGVKVRFPVGVPTSVPEPAAVLLKKMIELEQEEEANTAKPKNHYVGDVTIPAGKTLTLEKGSKLVDNSGGGEVVILPETELVYTSDGYILPVPLENAPAGGGNYKIVWDGVEYISPALDVTETMGYGDLSLAFGDSTILMGEEGAAAVGNPLPGAPFFMMLFPNGTVFEEGTPTFYGVFKATAEPTNPTLSIVQTEGAASGGESAASQIMIVNATSGVNPIEIESADKTYDEVCEAVIAGKIVFLRVYDGIGVLYAMVAGTETGTDSNNNTASVLFFALTQGFIVTWRYKEDGSWSATTN